MQRILARGEIESLDHTSILRLRQPVRSSVFADRAARLRQLAQDNPLSDYLLLMADLVDGQNQALKHCDVPGPTAERIDQAQTHGMPPLQAMGWRRDSSWRSILASLLDHMLASEGVPPQAVQTVEALKSTLESDPNGIEAQADAILAESEFGVDAATAPFIMAALQVYWTCLAADFKESDMPVVSPKGVCPLCGSLPVASVVRVGGQAEGNRYLCCSLCAAEWHLVRVTCSHCDDTKEISYHSIEDGPEGIKAESCDHCHTYRKIFYQEKALGADAVADDLASLMLDVLMGEAGYSRASGNPLLWQPVQSEP
ncbi:formate dehydrogenase accessory protein FdhE [Paenalcaligenes niemegkensis]|uniref:formate dehydrogenase accessory protein FdhE n=1 Tax=Paenalcaligenes niemegkensis TaxID=2895469 RepID=UPI001EE8331E|nr:formate dehydrogenase accessory protein FdhE [Paenalcaligenes niemegkensis]MCQ9617571.1 formate dehydrogenase accessory protein FdhE [Paenalcaligenes niemegkensis]